MLHAKPRDPKGFFDENSQTEEQMTTFKVGDTVRLAEFVGPLMKVEYIDQNTVGCIYWSETKSEFVKEEFISKTLIHNPSSD